MTGKQAFSLALDFVLAREGGLVDHPRDPGGLTNLGISLRWLRSLGLAGDLDGDGDVDADDVRGVTTEQAADLYHKHFWTTVGGDILPNRLACLVFDTAVNAGVSRAVKLLQASLNLATGSKLVEDGIFGRNTAQALGILRHLPSDESRIFDRYLVERTRFYLRLAEDKPSLRDFLRGWLNRVVDLDDYARRVFA